MAGYPCKRCGKPILIGQKGPRAKLSTLCFRCRDHETQQRQRAAISAAATASETFGDDELERFAEEYWARQQKEAGQG